MTDGADEDPDLTYVEDPPVAATESTYNAAEPAEIAAQGAKIRREKDEVADFWQRAMAEKIGRKVLWDLLTEEGLFLTVFGASPVGFPDANQTFFNMGRKDVATRLYSKLMLYDRVAIGIMHDENDSAYAKPKKRKAKDDDGTS